MTSADFGNAGEKLAMLKVLVQTAEHYLLEKATNSATSSPSKKKKKTPKKEKVFKDFHRASTLTISRVSNVLRRLTSSFVKKTVPK